MEKPVLIPLSREELRKQGIPVSPATFKYWRRMGRNRHLFVKIGRKVFLDYNEWVKFVKSCREG